MRVRQFGFTMIEVMIVLVIVAVLVAIAVPSYQDSVIKNNRSTAKTELMKASARQEQYFVNSKIYTTDLTNLGYPANGYYVNRAGDSSASSTNAVYQISFSSASSTAYTIQAVPIGTQQDDDQCSTLSISDTGAVSASGSLGTSCWQ